MLSPLKVTCSRSLKGTKRHYSVPSSCYVKKCSALLDFLSSSLKGLGDFQGLKRKDMLRASTFYHFSASPGKGKLLSGKKCPITYEMFHNGIFFFTLQLASQLTDGLPEPCICRISVLKPYMLCDCASSFTITYFQIVQEKYLDQLMW